MPSWLDKIVKIDKGEAEPETAPVAPAPFTPPFSTGPKAAPPVAPPPTVRPTVVTVRSPMDYSLDEVFLEGGAATDRNSAETVVKLREGLAAFPEAQQLAMVRAMDLADDSWNEATVLADANRRILITNEYLKLVDQDEGEQITRIQAETETATMANESHVADLDARIAALKAEREKVVQETSAAKATADGKVEAVKVRANGVRTAVRDVVAKYQNIIKFFGK